MGSKSQVAGWVNGLWLHPQPGEHAGFLKGDILSWPTLPGLARFVTLNGGESS